jgi:hypothetical protein
MPAVVPVVGQFEFPKLADSGHSEKRLLGFVLCQQRTSPLLVSSQLARATLKMAAPSCGKFASE